MTHEPECPIRNSEDPLTFYAARVGVATFCICPNIRYAYQRGREDAAKAVNMLAASWKVDENGWQILCYCMECGGTYDAYNLAIDDAYAAARGYGD